MTTMSRRRRRAGVIALAVLSLPVVACAGGSGEEGDSWPDVPVSSTVDGASISSAEVVADGTSVVSFWATWCAPCKRELPMLEEMAAEGTQVVGINIGDSADSVDAFLEDLGVTFPNYIDVDGEMMSQLDLPSLPATMIVVDGELVWQNLGIVTRDAIEEELTALAG